MLLSSILATDLGGLALGAWLLWGRGRARASSWAADLVWLAALGIVLGVSTMLAGWALGGGFLVLRLWCHALFCVLVPLAIARGVQRRGVFGVALAVIGLLAEGAYVWARRVEPFRLEITRHEIASPRLDGRSEPLRIAVLADLQSEDLGSFEQRVFAELDVLRADLVLIPGDLLQTRRSDLEWNRAERRELSALFASLRHRPRLGFLMVLGDCELPEVRFDIEDLRRLDDEAVLFAAARLLVIGLSRRTSRRTIPEPLAEAARSFPGLTIVFGHAPEFALSAPSVGVPLVCLAGHTHGGQVQLPFFGPLVTLSTVPRALAGGGLHRLGDSWTCVSRGIGMEGGYAPRIRFLCRPELVCLEFYPASRAAAPASPSAGTSAAAIPAARDRARATR